MTSVTMAEDVRYGIFLRPDPLTCWTVTQITLALRQQFGLVAAAAFPPHATLIGNLRIASDEADLIDALAPVFAAVSPLAVYNSGLTRTEKGTFEFNIDLDAHGQHSNQALARVAAAVKAAVLPLSVPHEDYLVTPVEQYEFAGHIGLASFELAVDPRLSDEVGEFLAGLPFTPPPSFVASWYSLFRFRAGWSGPWWEDMPWSSLQSWQAHS